MAYRSKKKNLKKITVLTVPNGYTLTYDGMKPAGGHMYFTPEQLLEGFMVHIGLEMTEQLDIDTMQDFIVAACNWKDNAKCIQEIEKLNTQVNGLRLRRNGLATKLIAERNRLLTMVEAIRKMEKKFKGTDIGDQLKAIIKSHVHTKPYTLKALGITSTHVVETEEPEEEDEE